MGVDLNISRLLTYQGVLRTRVADAINQANETIHSLAVQLAPVSAEGSGGNPPGYLRDHIEITKVATPESLSAETVSKARYSKDVEFGTVEHGDAQPFMAPAREAGNQDLRENLRGMGATRKPPRSLTTRLG